MKKLISAVLFASAAVLPSFAQADNYPSDAVTIVVPYPPGGTTDLLARLVAKGLGERTDQAFIVKNTPGAGGQVGSRQVAQAKPDGYTLVMGTINSHGINPALYEEMTYDALEDFTAVSLVASTPNVIIASTEAPYTTFTEMIEYAKKHPGEINFGSTSVGGSPHMAGELLKNVAQVDITHIPYQGGGPMIADVIGGQVDIGFDNLPSSAGHIQSGKVNALAVTTKERSPMHPDIPSIAELGYEDYDLAAWFGLLAPAGTPDNVLEFLSSSISEILAEEQTQKQLEALGALPVGSTPAEFNELIKAEITKWEQVVEENQLERL